MNNISRSIAFISFSVLALNASTTTSPEAAKIMCDAGITRIETQLEMEAEFEAITQKFKTETKQVQEKEAIKSHVFYTTAKCGLVLGGAVAGCYFAPAILTYSAVNFVPALYGCVFSATTSYVGYSLWWAGQYNAVGAVISQGFYPAILAGASIGGGIASTGLNLFTDSALYVKNQLVELDTEYGVSQSISNAYSELTDSTVYSDEIKKSGILSNLNAFSTTLWARSLWGSSTIA